MNLYKNPRANNILNGDTFEPLPLKPGKDEMLIFSLIFESNSIPLRLNNRKGRDTLQIVGPNKKA